MKHWCIKSGVDFNELGYNMYLFLVKLQIGAKPKKLSQL